MKPFVCKNTWNTKLGRRVFKNHVCDFFDSILLTKEEKGRKITREILRDPIAMKEIELGIAEVARGEIVEWKKHE